MKEKEEFLINLVRKYYPQGDSFFASCNKGTWRFGYSNDYPMQHGKGESFKLPDKMVEIMIKQWQELQQNQKE